MKKHKGLKEVHDIMERIYEEEKGLDSKQRARKCRKESDKFMQEQKLSLKRVKPKEPKHAVA